jgi:dihydrodipicolinate synthase/N-acetylneuraminate lyase
VSAIKYAVVRDQPEVDAYLSELVQEVDRTIVFSGIGERPAVIHLRDFELGGFTSGSVCVGPNGSTHILAALKRGDWDGAEKLRANYIPLEDLRDGYSPIRVLHEAVTLAGIANMGPMLPALSNIDAELSVKVKGAASELYSWDKALGAS